MLPASGIVTLHPAYRSLLDLLESHYVGADVPAKRWGWSLQHMANLRRAGKGPAYIKLARSVRYSVAEIVAWELGGQSYHVTQDRLGVAVAALRGYDANQKADIANQLASVLYGKGTL